MHQSQKHVIEYQKEEANGPRETERAAEGKSASIRYVENRSLTRSQIYMFDTRKHARFLFAFNFSRSRRHPTGGDRDVCARWQITTKIYVLMSDSLKLFLASRFLETFPRRSLSAPRHDNKKLSQEHNNKLEITTRARDGGGEKEQTKLL